MMIVEWIFAVRLQFNEQWNMEDMQDKHNIYIAQLHHIPCEILFYKLEVF